MSQAPCGCFRRFRADRYRPSFVNVRQTMSDPRLFGTAKTNFTSAWKFTNPKCQGVTTSFPRGDFDATHLWHCRSSPQRGSRRVGQGVERRGKRTGRADGVALRQSHDMGPPVRSEWPKFDGRCVDRQSAWCVPPAQLPSDDSIKSFLA